jgi:predicted MFS family arabinose efflux permease
MIHLQSGQTVLAAALLCGALVVLGGFLGWQVHLKQSAAPSGIRLLMDLDLFRYRQFAIGCLVSFTYGAALYGSIDLLPVYLQVGLRLDPTLAGSMLLPAGLTLAASVTLAGRMADHVAPHKMVFGGLLLLGGSFAMVELLGLKSPLYWMVALSALGRVGLGLVLPSLNLGTLRGLPSEAISEASSSMNFLRMVGGTIGVSLCGVALQWRLSAHGVRFDEAEHAVTRLLAFNEVFFLLAMLCALAMLAAWWLRPMPEN